MGLHADGIKNYIRCTADPNNAGVVSLESMQTFLMRWTPALSQQDLLLLIAQSGCCVVNYAHFIDVTFSKKPEGAVTQLHESARKELVENSGQLEIAQERSSMIANSGGSDLVNGQCAVAAETREGIEESLLEMENLAKNKAPEDMEMHFRAVSVAQTLRAECVSSQEKMKTLQHSLQADGSLLQHSVHQRGKLAQKQCQIATAAESLIYQLGELCTLLDEDPYFAATFDRASILNEDPGAVTFEFLSAAKVHEWTGLDGVLLPYQELRKKSGCVVEKTLNIYEVLRHGYAGEMGVVSHRWATPAHPDPKAIKVQKIREFLVQNPAVKYVWIDFCCVPQGHRTDQEQALFSKTLKHVNLLYLGMRVLIIFDTQYPGRFWTCYEAWLSMQSGSVRGLAPAGPTELRYSIKCIGASTTGAEAHQEALVSTWSKRGAVEVARILKQDDIEVTNMSDKEGQLKRLSTLEQRVKETFTVFEVKEKESIEGASASMAVSAVAVMDAVYPDYWMNPVSGAVNDQFVDVVEMTDPSLVESFQQVFDFSYSKSATRERTRFTGSPVVPKRFLVTQVWRCENSNSWSKYATKRTMLLNSLARISATYMDVKSTTGWSKSARDLMPQINEWYLFFSSSPGTARMIAKNGWNESEARGSSTGTLYGPGVYLCDSITRADESARPGVSDSFPGELAVMFCRALGGNVHYTDQLCPDPEELTEKLTSGQCDCILGDREKLRGTFKEYVFGFPGNLYVEYIIHYKREYE